MLKRITWRPIVAALVLLITVVVFADYFSTHPAVRHQLRQTSPGVLVLLIALYGIFIGCIALINSATLNLCKLRLKVAENVLLTMYSSVINFFGPLQSGPAFRALYLKQKHGLRLREYTAASLLYYFFYGFFSGLLLLSGIFHWWLLGAVVLLGGVISWLRATTMSRLQPIRQLARGPWLYLALASMLQVFVLAIIYYVELRAVSPHVQIGQALVYTGAANFALFVSLTPGAIGFREAFLVFSQRLHHIDNATIVSANLIDRSVYIVLLLILMIGIVATHANNRFRVKAD